MLSEKQISSKLSSFKVSIKDLGDSSSLILLEDVRKLGRAGTIVSNVAPGYARYLINYNKATKATKKNLVALEERKVIIEQNNSEKLKAAQSLKEKLADYFLVIIRQASDDGKLFGSVTAKDVSKLLKAEGYDLDYTQVFFSSGGIIKNLGEHRVNLELYIGCEAEITVYIVRSATEQEEVIRKCNEAKKIEEEKSKAVEMKKNEESQEQRKDISDGSDNDNVL